MDDLALKEQEALDDLHYAVKRAMDLLEPGTVREAIEAAIAQWHEDNHEGNR